MDRSAAAPRKRVLLDGPYGQANLGDNAIAWCMASFLRTQGLHVTISCLDPTYVASSFGLDAVPMLDYRRLEFSVLKRIRDFDAVIVGGGQQLQEQRIPNPFVGMLSRICRMAQEANRCGVPFVAWAVGMDWPLSRLSRRMIRKHLGHENVTLIFRDRASFDNAKELLAGTRCRIHQGKDAVFMIKDLLKGERLTEGVPGEGSSRKSLIISPSLVAGGEASLQRIIDAGIAASENGYAVTGWHSEIRPAYDQVVRNLVDWSAIPDFRWLPADAVSTREVCGIIGSASLILTTRMHPAIIATSLGVPAYGIATNDKMRAVFKEMRLPFTDLAEIETLTFRRVVQSDYGAAFSRSAEFAREAAASGRYVANLVNRPIGRSAPRLSGARPWADL